MTVGNVALRQFYCRNNRRIFDDHFVVIFVFFFNATKDWNRIFCGWLIHQNCLKTSNKRFVFFEVLLVFIQGSCSNCSQFSSRQRRFQNVRRIHGAFSSSCTNQGVNLIDEQDDFSFRRDDFFHHSLQAFLKLTFVLCTGN